MAKKDIIPFEEPKENQETGLEIIEGEVLDVQYMVEVYGKFAELVKKVLVLGVDYGDVAGSKPSLFKPGAEKMRRFFKLYTETHLADKTEQWSVPFGETEFPLFSYTYNTVVKDEQDRIIATCEGNCNSYETKYRWRWSQDPHPYDPNKLATRGGKEFVFAFALEKKETTGSYGKPIEYWNKWQEDVDSGRATQSSRKTSKGKVMDTWERDGLEYRIPSDTIFDQVNTLMKMGQKRSFVGAILLATGASEFFTQDLEDYAHKMGVEEVSVRTFVPNRDNAARRLIAYVKSKGIDEPGEWIKVLLADNEISFSLDNWDAILDLVDSKV